MEKDDGVPAFVVLEVGLPFCPLWRSSMDLDDRFWWLSCCSRPLVTPWTWLWVALSWLDIHNRPLGLVPRHPSHQSFQRLHWTKYGTETQQFLHGYFRGPHFKICLISPPKHCMIKELNLSTYNSSAHVFNLTNSFGALWHVYSEIFWLYKCWKRPTVIAAFPPQYLLAVVKALGVQVKN